MNEEEEEKKMINLLNLVRSTGFYGFKVASVFCIIIVVILAFISIVIGANTVELLIWCLACYFLYCIFATLSFWRPIVGYFDLRQNAIIYTDASLYKFNEILTSTDQGYLNSDGTTDFWSGELMEYKLHFKTDEGKTKTIVCAMTQEKEPRMKSFIKYFCTGRNEGKYKIQVQYYKYSKYLIDMHLIDDVDYPTLFKERFSELRKMIYP